MQVKSTPVQFGLYSYEVGPGVAAGLRAFASDSSISLPVQMQPNDQFTRMEGQLERIAGAVEKMATQYRKL